jgi:hypothetical protein
LYRTGSHTRQWDLTANRVKKSKKKQVTVGKGNAYRRGCSPTYTFTVNDPEIKVCKTMFLQSLDIKDMSVGTAFRKLGEGNCISPDKRHSHKIRPHALSNDVNF